MGSQEQPEKQQDGQGKDLAPTFVDPRTVIRWHQEGKHTSSSQAAINYVVAQIEMNERHGTQFYASVRRIANILHLPYKTVHVALSRCTIFRRANSDGKKARPWSFRTTGDGEKSSQRGTIRGAVGIP
jgi:hypothetical protein